MTNNTTAPGLTDEQRKAVEFAIELIENDRGDRTVTSRTLRALLTSPRAAGLPEGWKVSRIDDETTCITAPDGREAHLYQTIKKGIVTIAYEFISAMLDAAPAAPVAEPMIDIEQMLRDCVPGGDIVDPQFVCDSIRSWFEDRASVAAQAVAADGAQSWHHELKTDPDVFAAVLAGDKTHEIRYNDRGFKVGDTLRLRETRYSGESMKCQPDDYLLEYTGREVTRVVSHVLDGYGLMPGWVVLSFAPERAAVSQATAEQRAAFETCGPEACTTADRCNAEQQCGWRTIGRASQAAASATVHSTWRHLKTSGIYDILMHALYEADKETVAIVYRSRVDGQVWVRPGAEFYDGRFERVEQAAAPAEARPTDDAEEMRDAAMRTVQAMGLVYSKGSDRWRPQFGVAPADAGEAVALTAAARDVLAERARQMSVEGWTPEHDDQHDGGELASAAACYALNSAGWTPFTVNEFWPPHWLRKWWKPTTPRRDLEKAGALIQAEIERLDRAEAAQGAQGGKGGEA